MEDLKIQFDFDDILIVPEVNTSITSRYNDIVLPNKLPIFTAPMDTVVNEDNIDTFMFEKINITLPRTIKYSEYNERFGDFDYGYYKNVFVSFGFEDIDFQLKTGLRKLKPNLHMLIDVANGHMQKILDYSKEIKRLRPDIVIMVGNIANPETYAWYAKNNCVDYIRVGIGNGCFVAGSKITTKNGVKNIEDIVIGDEVLSHSGEYKLVASTQKRGHTDDLIQINNIICTPNHEFYVLNKKYLDIINDDNAEKLCEWISAKELSETDVYLLIEINTDHEDNVKF